MPWCPNCKTEYREGITHCADCKAELVADYKDVLSQNATEALIKVDREHNVFAHKLKDFLAYSGVPSVVQNEGELLGVYVTPEDLKKAKKCFKAFYSVEAEMVMQRAEEAAFLKGEEYEDYFGDDEEEAAPESSDEEAFDADILKYKTETPYSVSALKTEKRFVSAASRYEDYRSSGYTFTVLGTLGVGFALLNFMDVISLFGSTFSSTILFLMFGIFLGLGIFSFVKAGTLKNEALIEQKLIENVKAWMQANITKELLSSVSDVTGSGNEEGQTEELLYLDRIDKLLKLVHTAFPTLHDSLAEQLLEEFCNEQLE